MRTLTNLFLNTVQRHPDRLFVHHRGSDHTYAHIAGRATALARWLTDQGLQRGDRVAIVLPNSPEYIAAYFGIMLAGGVVVGLNPDTTARELAWTLNHCGAAGIVYDDRVSHLVAQVAPQVPSLRCLITCGDAPDLGNGRSCVALATLGEEKPPSSSWLRPDDLAQIIYTSGTTGQPKGVTLSHRNLVANTFSIVEYLRLSHDDAVFVILPFFYSYGNSLLLTHVAVGGRLILTPDFVFWNRALDVMKNQGATGFSGVPSSYAILLHKSGFLRRSFPALRYLTCAGGGLAPAVVQRIREAFPHIEIYLMYGQTEASARLSSLMPWELDRKPGSIGKGIPGVELRVLDDEGRPVRPGEIGEIVARGENIMVGYWNDPEGTARVKRPEGLRTGDLATVDEDGYIYVVGRKSDLIKSGSFRIHPKEIEEAILELDGVAEVAVVGLPDEMLGEAPVAFVVPSPAGELTEADVIQHCARTLPRYKVVSRVVFVDSLPKTSSGKVQRHVLREQYNAQPA